MKGREKLRLQLEYLYVDMYAYYKEFLCIYSACSVTVEICSSPYYLDFNEKHLEKDKVAHFSFPLLFKLFWKLQKNIYLQSREHLS